ncbi:hypothetical protein FKX85_06635 [Echinicola soli]|uniref:Multi-ubiquitin domain-containing protein n=1 Tax=Echinicola soli TaxID=2591634 RepID=A0A514CFZ0_9BACT|nr:multiubiquitin domain-containing protein [Echinicola soli]QDH78729.1 hypothetical protein FKX85_06635 [Echinicola soli]
MKNKIDIEAFYLEGKKVETGCFYMIKVTSDITGEKDKFLVEKEKVTGREILLLSDHTPPKNFILKIKGKNKRTIELDDIVDLTEPGIEKFIVYPASCTEGSPSPRRDFHLFPDDQKFLSEKQYTWEAITEGRVNWILIKGFKLPNGLNHASIDIAVKIPQQYPRAEIDMIFFPAKISRDNGREFSRQTPTTFRGKHWYQWSRHRNKRISPWKPGVDNLETHLDLMYHCLQQEAA